MEIKWCLQCRSKNAIDDKTYNDYAELCSNCCPLMVKDKCEKCDSGEHRIFEEMKEAFENRKKLVELNKLKKIKMEIKWCLQCRSKNDLDDDTYNDYAELCVSCCPLMVEGECEKCESGEHRILEEMKESFKHRESIAELKELKKQKITDGYVEIVPLRTIKNMSLKEFLINFIPPAWNLIFQEMIDELEDAGLTVQHDINNSRIQLVPNKEDIYNAFVSTPPDDIKVVIIGMDPYYKVHRGKPSATGRCFECHKGMPIEKSLQQIFSVCCKTIKGFNKPTCGDLSKWAEQGVFLLNAALTTRAGKSGQHLGAWMFLPEKILKYLGEKKKNIVYMFWGKDAQNFVEFIPTHRNKILTSSHPVAWGKSNTFLDSNHFNEANDYFEDIGRKQIDWIL